MPKFFYYAEFSPVMVEFWILAKIMLKLLHFVIIMSMI